MEDGGLGGGAVAHISSRRDFPTLSVGVCVCVRGVSNMYVMHVMCVCYVCV